MTQESLRQRSFWAIASLSRRFDGIRPRRFGTQAAVRAFRTPPDAASFRIIEDIYGTKLLVHPYYLVDREIVLRGTYERPLQRFISRALQPGDNAIDVGANIGAMSITMARAVGRGGTVIAVEPSPEMAMRLRSNIALNPNVSVCVVEEAIGATEGSAILRVPKGSNPGEASLVVPLADSESVEVSVVSLNSLVHRFGLTNLRLLKVDIQGGEVDLFRGGAECLQRFRPIIVSEVGPEELASVGFDARTFIQFMNELDYSAHSLCDSGALGDSLTPKSVAPDQYFSSVIFTPGS